jgi:predicted aconitase with swiveling domain
VSIPLSIATTGAHTITFAGTDPSDKTTFIDAVTLIAGSVAATTTTLVSSPNPSTVGASVVFTATVTGNAPTGSVGFTADGVILSGCSTVVLPAGSASSKTATCGTAALAVGTHSIVATYAGDTGNIASTSSTLSQVVNAGSPPAALVNPSFEVPALGSGYQYNPSTSGVGWTFSANSGIQGNGSAWGAAPAADGTQTAFVQGTGSISQTLSLNAGGYTLSFQAARRNCCVSPFVQPIQVSVDGVPVGSLVAPASTSFGNVSIPLSIATTGAHTVTFAGTDPSDKTTFIDAVTLSAGSVTSTTTTLTSSANPSTVGSSVAFTATVNGSAPTGSVAFTADSTPISGCSAVGSTGGTVNAPMATCSTSSLGQGVHSIVATYAGDAGNSSSTSAALSQVVNTGSGTDVVWVEDSVPAGATATSDGGDVWNWISSNPPPYAGALAHQSVAASGEHQHYFYNATATLTVASSDTLFGYVYLDPANLPSEVMLQWNDGSWEHRAYWGSNLIGWGTDGTVSRQYMGALPAAGQWVRLAVPAAQVGLVGSTLNGMAYTLSGGRATWDHAGKTASGP